jgi:hypothetical protein
LKIRIVMRVYQVYIWRLNYMRMEF